MSWKLRLAAVAGAMAVSLYACGPAGDPVLGLTARPRSIDNMGQVATITVTATAADGKPGTGKVRLSSPAGSLKTATEVDLLAGEVTVDFSCDAAQDPGCKGPVRITGEWVVNGKLIEAVTTVTVATPDSGAGGGGGTDAGTDAGTGGGTGGGMGMDGGASLVVTPARTTIFKSVGDSTTISAVLTQMGTPLAGETVNWSTDLGQLSLLDGGAAGPTVTTSTDGAGQAQVRFSETGTGGSATITAMAPDAGAVGTTTVRVLEVNAIVHEQTVCGQTNNCTVMGIRNSGFNETATIKFKVRDAQMNGLAGVPVSFVANGAPAGLTISPNGVTDSQGIVQTTAQSGSTVGTFTVTATAFGTLSVTSPTIGVRGAKPSNQGFTVQCAKVNLAAYVSPSPPLALTNNCVVTLVDRLGNPVGRVTSVNLNSEAGAVPANIMTTGFDPRGSNMNEGKGSFTFSTVGVWPAVDVPPLPASSGQYPFARGAEPSYMDGALERNPRDGLVTIIAYTDGEEHFYDDNANGIRDANERFIDQGEPFLDVNDNNVWDSGEPIVDVDGNNAWTPANGVWDANTKIWTVAHLLYTDATRGAVSFFSPTTFTVPKGSQALIDAYMPDLNLNHIESGAMASVSRLSSRGQTSLVNSNLALDGYGFVFEGRRLVNATGTGPCDATTPICSFKTIFGSWGVGLIGRIQVIGVPLTDMSPSEADTITVTTTVRGVAGSRSISGTIQ